jgi:competence protein ComEA
LQLKSMMYGKWVIILLAAVVAALGWLGYSVWRSGTPAGATTGWHSANEEMKQLLEQQTDEWMNKNKSAQTVSKVPSASGKQVDGTINSSGSAAKAVEIADVEPTASGPSSGSSPGSSSGPSSGPSYVSGSSDAEPAEPKPADPLPAASIPKPAAQKKAEAGLIHLNKATEAQLTAIPGIGASKAKAIIAHRKQIGRYQSVDQLLDVKGIGDKLLDKMKPYLLIDP